MLRHVESAHAIPLTESAAQQRTWSVVGCAASRAKASYMINEVTYGQTDLRGKNKCQACCNGRQQLGTAHLRIIHLHAEQVPRVEHSTV